MIGALTTNLLRKFNLHYIPEKELTINNVKYLMRGLHRNGAPDYDEAWFNALCGQKEIVRVYDVGSNVGYSSLIALQHPNVRKVMLIEANPEALQLAAFNMFRNGFSCNTSFINCFVSDIDNLTVPFFTTGTGEAGSMYRSHAKTAGAMNSQIETQTLTLDSIIAAFFNIPDLIKIDVEGAELQALNGLVKTLSTIRKLANSTGLGTVRYPQILVEMHSNPDLTMLQNAKNVLAWCDGNDYFAWYLAKHHRLTRPQQIEDRGRCHLLLQFAEFPYPECLKPIDQGDPLSFP